MNYNLLSQFGKMFPDYIHPALADAADATAQNVEPSQGPTKTPVSFAEVTAFVAEFYASIEGLTSFRSFPRLGSSGLQEHGHFLMLNSLVLHSGDSASSVCSLGEILEPNAAPKYSLSPRACRGILRRAQKRGRTLPPPLEAVLQQVAASTQAEEGEMTT